MLRKVLWLALACAVLLAGLWGSRMLSPGNGKEPRGPAGPDGIPATVVKAPKSDVTPAQELQIQQDTAAVAAPETSEPQPEPEPPPAAETPPT